MSKLVSYKLLSAGILMVVLAAVSVMAAEVYSVRRGQEIIANIASQKLQEESVKRLKNLGMRLVCYANDRNERYPDKIEQLKDFDVNDADIKWFNENVEYRGRGLSITEPPYTVIAYEKNLAKIGETAVLFNDTEVVIVSTEKLMSMLSAESNSGAAAQEAKPKDIWENKKSQNEKWNPLALQNNISKEAVAFSKPFEEKRQTWMTVTHDIKDKKAVCLVVIDDNGKEHAAAQTITLCADAFTQITVAFDIPLAKVVSFHLKTRSYKETTVMVHNQKPNKADPNSIPARIDEQVKEQLKRDPLILDFDKKISQQEQLLAGIRATRGENDPQIRQVQDLISEFKEEKQKRKEQITDQTRRAAEKKPSNKIDSNSVPAGDPIVLHLTKQKQELELELEKYSLMHDQNSQKIQQQLREQINTVKQEIQQRETQVAEQARNAAKNQQPVFDPNSQPAR